MMDNDQLLSLLSEKLAEVNREAEEHEELAAAHATEAQRCRSLAISIQTTIEGLTAKVHSPFSEESSCVKDSAPLNGSQANINPQDEDTDFNEAAANQDADSTLESQTEAVRLPKDMKRPRFKKRGYVEIAREVLSEHPEGLLREEFVPIVFDTQSQEEFERASNSFIVELNRGVREERLYKDEKTDRYYLEPPKALLELPYLSGMSVTPPLESDLKPYSEAEPLLAEEVQTSLY